MGARGMGRCSSALVCDQAKMPIVGRFMARPILAALSGIAFFASWFWRELVKTAFFDRVLHMVTPGTDALLEYGPPLAFAALTVYLLVGQGQ